MLEISSHKLRNIKIKQNILILVYLIFSLVAMMTVYNFSLNDYNKWLSLFTVVNVLHFGILCLILRNFNFKWISFSGFFIILGYLFHFGQLYLDQINYDFDRVINYIRYFNPYLMKQTLLFSFLVFIFTNLGIILSLNNASSNNIKISKDSKKKLKLDNTKTLQTIGWIIVIIFFPINLYIDFSKLSLTMSGNYLDSFETGISGIWVDLTMLSYIGFILLILAYSKIRWKTSLLTIFLISYLVFSIFNGSRGKQVLLILLLIYIIHNQFVKINWKNTLLLLIIMIFGFAFLDTIAQYRNLFDKNMSIFLEIFIDSLKVNPIFGIISEIGATIQTPYLIIQQVPSQVSFGEGSTFYKSIFTVFPNVAGILDNILESIKFMWKIRGRALGGSYVGELYYNFGVYGSIIAIPFGYIIQKISSKMSYLLISKNYYYFAFYIPIFINGLWWVRNNFSSIVRISVWNALLLVFLRLFLTTIKYKNKPML